MKIKQEMLKIYKPVSHLDWMNYKLVKTEVTYHHIQKACDSGKTTIENGALLMPIAHQYLHLIENIEIEAYVRLNEIFKVVNEQRHEPTPEQRAMVEYILQVFESVHKWDKGKKGKILVQRKYLERDFNRSK